MNISIFIASVIVFAVLVLFIWNFTVATNAPCTNGLVLSILFVSLWSLLAIPKNIIDTTNRVNDILSPLKAAFDKTVTDSSDKVTIDPELPTMRYGEALDYLEQLREVKTRNLKVYSFGVEWETNGFSTSYHGIYFELEKILFYASVWIACMCTLHVLVKKEVETYGYARWVKSTI